MSDQFADIRAVLKTYFDGLYTCDTALLAEAFHPRAVYATADETPPLIRSMEEYFPVVAKRRSPASQNAPRRDVIESIEFAGENAAMARVRCTINTRDFVDFLCLIHDGERWRIMSKIFHIAEERTS